MEPVQPNHCASLYGELILVILEPKSYLVRGHKLQIRPRNGLGLVLGHLMGFLQPTLSPFWILGGYANDLMWPVANLVNKIMFMELGNSETDWGSSRD